MTEGRTSPDPLHSGTLDERVLAALEGSQGRLAFSGLRRVLGAHPESLTRALHRLARDGRVERVDGGYRSLAPAPPGLRGWSEDLRRIARVDLPPGTSPASVAGRLAGRWFGGLRWVGAFERRGERLLAWAQRDGSSPVLLGVGPSGLHVYAGDGRPGVGGSPEAGYELLVHAVDLLRSPESAADAPGGGIDGTTGLSPEN